MRRSLQLLVVVGWFLLAGYVIVRSFVQQARGYDVMVACWCGGVLSALCVQILVSRRRTTTGQ